jgi:alcohol dehydrogenase class IV
LGGNFGLDHARTHTALLPYILDYQWDYLPELVRQDFNAVWPETRAAQGLWQQLQSLGLALSLQSLGLTAEALPEAAAQISALAFVNPAPTDHKAIYQLLTRAYEGYLS